MLRTGSTAPYETTVSLGGVMFGPVRRAWRDWRDKARLLAPLQAVPPDMFPARDLRFPELQAVAAAGGPELPAYQALAEVWDDYVQLPDYPAYLTALARRDGVGLRSVLDLACGTGTLTVRLAGVAAEVVGLDASPAMLAVARRRESSPGVSWAEGDFREFDLGRPFDAAVCASNSLNYVADRGELGRVFAAVARHLRPGGRFVFDVSTERGMRGLSGHYLHFRPGGRPLALRFEYDWVGRRETAAAILPAGIETHRRVPIEPADVAAAVAGTGLVAEDRFDRASAVFSPGNGWLMFYVLRRAG